MQTTVDPRNYLESNFAYEILQFSFNLSPISMIRKKITSQITKKNKLGYIFGRVEYMNIMRPDIDNHHISLYQQTQRISMVVI